MKMKRHIALTVALAVTLLTIARARDQDPRVVMISVDGLMPSSYTESRG